jgi:hypothetical protein
MTAMVTVASLLTSNAYADPAKPESDVQRAVRLFQEGERLFEAKQTREACDAFAESQRLDPTLGTLLNLAYCHEAIGKVATAWNEYNEAAAWAAQRGRKDRERFALDHASELAPRISRVQLEIPRGVVITSIEVDGQAIPRAKWRLPVFVDPGEHTLRVLATGKKQNDSTFRIDPGPGLATVFVPRMEDEPPARPPPAPPEPEAPPINVRRTLGFAVGAVGIVGLGVGTFFGVRTLQKRDESELHCVGSLCDAQGVELLDDSHSMSTISTVGFAVGIVGIVTGTILVLTAPSSPAPPKRASSGIVPAPYFAAGGGGLQLVGQF